MVMVLLLALPFAAMAAPRPAPTNATVLVLGHMVEPLVAYEGAPFKLTPRLASSWTVKDNR